MTSLIGVYGASGFGREIMPILREQTALKSNCSCVFVDDSYTSRVVNGHRCMTFSEFVSHPAENRYMSLAIGDSSIRAELSKACTESNIHFQNIHATTSITMDNVTLGEGSILCGFTTITSNVVIGRHFHANIYSYVAHDCVVGDFVTFAPAVKCNGNVHVGDHAYIGTGAVLRQGTPDKPLRIGAGAIVGMGAVVTRDVAPNITVVGNPAKPLLKS